MFDLLFIFLIILFLLTQNLLLYNTRVRVILSKIQIKVNTLIPIN